MRSTPHPDPTRSAASPDGPLVFAPQWRPWWVRGYGIVFLIAIALVGAAMKDTLEVPGDLLIGAAFLTVFFTFLWGVHKVGSRHRLAFDGWTIRTTGPLGKVREFDARDIIRIRLWRQRGVVAYRVRLRGRDRFWHEFGIPMRIYGTQRVYDELLSRVAAVEGIDADRQTAELLEGWRTFGAGTTPPVRA